jgi:hypothetical protein
MYNEYILKKMGEKETVAVFQAFCFSGLFLIHNASTHPVVQI